MFASLFRKEVWMWDLDCLGPKRLEFAISPVDAAEIFRTSNLWLSFLAVCQCVLGLFLEGSFQGSLLKWVQILPHHNQDVLYHVVDMSPLFVCFIHFTTNLGALLTPRSWSLCHRMCNGAASRRQKANGCMVFWCVSCHVRRKPAFFK